MRFASQKIAQQAHLQLITLIVDCTGMWIIGTHCIPTMYSPGPQAVIAWHTPYQKRECIIDLHTNTFLCNTLIAS
jgi:hypothetical protein